MSLTPRGFFRNTDGPYEPGVTLSRPSSGYMANFPTKSASAMKTKAPGTLAGGTIVKPRSLTTRASSASVPSSGRRVSSFPEDLALRSSGRRIVTTTPLIR